MPDIKFNPPWEGPPVTFAGAGGFNPPLKQEQWRVQKDLFYTLLDEAIKDEEKAIEEYKKLIELADKLGYLYAKDALEEIAWDEREHLTLLYQIKEAMPGPYRKLPYRR